MSLFAAILLLCLGDDYTSVQKKFDRIETGKLPSGSRVYLSANELSAFAREQARQLAPAAIHNVKLLLGEGSANASATIDFAELTAGWLAETFLLGARPVKVAARIQSRNGQARVDVESVEVGGAVMQGAALDFLIQHYVIPQFPDAKIAQWLPMADRIDHLEIHPAGVAVVIGK